MAGHLGAEQVTVQNLVDVKVDAEANLIAIRGAVPGPKGGVVFSKEHYQGPPRKEHRGPQEQQPAEGLGQTLRGRRKQRG